ncbi:MAG: ABC transporter permease [Candidatus Methylarchaceae archaeon HK02M1]|nr:ABC transporter permease [Candidatus Methylarchaceae archaeon HK01M]MCP8311592.1 ABC transporter permease [Candidatus Methylarchaceae archaeon HK02M1]
MFKTVRFATTMARRSIGRRKFRSSLTILGVIIGIAAIVSLMTLGYGMRYQVETTLNEMLGAGIIISSIEGSIDIPEHVYEFVSQIPGVNTSVPLVMTWVYLGDQPTMVVGIDPSEVAGLYHVTYEDGRGLESGEDNGILFSSATANNLGINVDDKVTISTGLDGTGFGETFTVVGIVSSLGTEQMNIGCFITLKAAQEMLDKKDYVSAIMVRLDDPSQGEQVEAALKNMFPDAQVISQEELMSQIGQIMDIIDGVLIGLGSISLGVGALGIMNTIMMSVHERRREIGMLKAVGAERRHILFIFLSEAFLISFVGGVFGCIFGLFGVSIAQWLMTFFKINITIPLIVSPYILGIGLTAAISVGILAGFFPSWTAANIRPVEALRYE